MSDRALLDELIQWKNLHTFVNSEYTEYLISKNDLDEWIEKKKEEIRTRMAAFQSRSFRAIKDSNLQEYFCQYCIHYFDSFDCDEHCKTIATEFKEKEEQKDGN